MKIKFLCAVVLCLGTCSAFADQTIKPIINGKVYNTLNINLKSLPKPLKVIKGEDNECVGKLPDTYKYKGFSADSDGMIREVYLTGQNAVMFYGKKVDSSMTKAEFLKLFKGKVEQATDNKNRYYANSPTDEYISISFYLRNDHIEKYELWVDDC